MIKKWKAAIYGAVSGDAIGVPVEFTSREDRKVDPVIGMRGYGTHNQPAGTWSDDSSMILATMDSISKQGKLNYENIMERFGQWCLYGDYTPFGELFDIGDATVAAIKRYGRGALPIDAGGTGEWDNGNGSLMRILPACLFVLNNKSSNITEDIKKIHSTSALTHAHLRSKIACGLYYFMIRALIEYEGSMVERLQMGIKEAVEFYRKDDRNVDELENYKRLYDLVEFRMLSEQDIKSSGYVVDTLEATVWSLINTDSYEDAVLRAVNLGDDTDTVGTVTGGLAGVFYGYESIPSEWIDTLQRKELIDDILARCSSLNG